MEGWGWKGPGTRFQAPQPGPRHHAPGPARALHGANPARDLKRFLGAKAGNKLQMGMSDSVRGDKTG